LHFFEKHVTCFRTY